MEEITLFFWKQEIKDDSSCKVAQVSEIAGNGQTMMSLTVSIEQPWHWPGLSQSQRTRWAKCFPTWLLSMSRRHNWHGSATRPYFIISLSALVILVIVGMITFFFFPFQLTNNLTPLQGSNKINERPPFGIWMKSISNCILFTYLIESWLAGCVCCARGVLSMEGLTEKYQYVLMQPFTRSSHEPRSKNPEGKQVKWTCVEPPGKTNPSRHAMISPPSPNNELPLSIVFSSGLIGPQSTSADATKCSTKATENNSGTDNTND